MKNRLYRVLLALGLVAVAAGVRVWPLGELGTIIPWLTFYPAVAVAAASGGFVIGVGAAAVSALIVLFAGPLLVAQPFITTRADWIGLVVFVFNCSLIAWIAEAMLQARERARQAQQQAEASNRAKSIFLASMSHELRTPLNAILGFSGLLARDATLTAHQRDTLGIINRSGEHLLRLINDVLDMSKIEAGRMVLEQQPFEIVGLVQDICDLMSVRAVDKSLTLQLKLDSQQRCWLLGDAAKLRQALINLVGNAIKFTPHGGITVRLRISASDAGARQVVGIDIEDTGIGIAPDDQQRVFEPFVQIGTAATTSQGSGLGLAITARIIAVMGGHIELHSTPGVGSRFVLEIPFSPAAAATATARPARGRVLGLAPGQRAPRILIVEDQMENWLLLQHILEEVGCIVQVAQNGAEGVTRFKDWQPDFIWMDIRMPVLDGLQATQQIRQLPGGDTVRIVALTASVFKEERAQVLQAGMNDLVRKPYQIDEVFDCLERQLGLEFVRTPESTPVAVPAQALELTGDTLAAIDADLREQLRTALLQLDSATIDALIAQVCQQLPEIGQALRQASAQLAYSSIIRALDACPQLSTKEAQQ